QTWAGCLRLPAPHVPGVPGRPAPQGPATRLPAAVPRAGAPTALARAPDSDGWLPGARRRRDRAAIAAGRPDARPRVQEQPLAGELLALVGRERAARYSQEETQRIWPKATKALRALATAGRAPDAPATLRARAGLALGQLCYGGLEALSRPAPPALL